ncbi:MAG: leucine-rich repeat protein [Lachnospiraceae bacterium]|nr:leucine-rich repeat protein [Lachnospiraceae bacterium]
MAKTTSKKPRLRLKKQVRRTLGGIFLASAVAVAAIPAGSRSGGNVEASVNETGSGEIHEGTTISNYSVTVNDSDTSDTGNIPQITAATKIYTDESKAFEFAYVQDNNNQYVAVIVGYGTLSLTNGTLQIPETFDAYTQYNTNSTNGQLVAVGRNGNFLFYPKQIETAAEYDEVVEDLAGAALTDDAGRALFTDSATPYSVSATTVNRFYKEDVTDPDTGTVTTTFYNVDTGVAFAGDVATLRALHASQTVHHDATYDTNFVPCYLDSLDEWKGYTEYELYYDKEHLAGEAPAYSVRNDSDHGEIYIQCENETQYHRIKDAAVAYISNQYAERDSNGIWTYDPNNTLGKGNLGGDAKNNTSKGIFANNANISTLIIKGTLVGIGDNAFYGCSGLTSLDLSGSNGLQVIGPGAFSDCYQLTDVTFTAAGQGTNLKRIGERAFYNCRSLKSVILPKSVTTIGDSCFEGCVKISTLDLCGGGDGGDAALAFIGVDAFKDCQSVTELVFPWNAKGKTSASGSSVGLLLSEFSGCASLGKVSVRNEELTFVPETNYDYDDFKTQQGVDNGIVAGTFYFEGFSSSKIHDFCKSNCFAFHYIGANDYLPLSPDIYELKVMEDGGGYVTYQVNVNNELQFPVNFEGNVESLSFPDHIGPYHIASIAANAFNNKCTLKRITIPSTIQSIGDGAFRGCHNVEYVVFDNDSVVIGNDAFKTQDFAGAHMSGSTSCSGLGENKVATNSDNTPEVKLTFVGPIDANSAPYQYAMSQKGTYNNGSQATSYIEYCSGWPSFITVRYNGEDTNDDGIVDNYFSELVDFPTRDVLNEYAAKSYLTEAQKEAASDVINILSDPNSTVQLTEDMTIFKDAASSLTIPTGINRIKDGLYYSKTETASFEKFPVIIMDIDSIEADIMRDSNGNPVEGTKDAQGIVYTIDPANSDFAGCSKLNSITIFGGADTIDDYAFYGCTNLESLLINSQDTTEIGDYAFGNCPKLATASISSTVSSLGKAPFVGDSELPDVNFNNSSYYKCDSQVIYGLSAGNPVEFVEMLPKRNSSYRSDAAITTVRIIDEDAFNTSSVSTVDLSKAPITEVPYHAFYNAGRLSRVIMPNACTTVGKYVFEDSTPNEISGSSSIVYPPAEFLDKIKISDGVYTDSTNTSNNHNVTVYAPENSNLNTYAVRYEYNAEVDMTPADYTVNFYGYDESTGLVSLLVSSQVVTDGNSPTSAMALYSVVSGYTDSAGRSYIMQGWETTDRTVYTNEEIDAYIVDGDINFFAHYVLADITYHTVTFNDYYDAVYKTYSVADGDTLESEQLDPPVLPDLVDEEGVSRTHTGWYPDGSVTVTSPITRDVIFRPIYSKSSGPYTVTLNYENPTDGSIAEITVIENVENGTDITSQIALYNVPSFAGYNFSGWSNALIVPTTSSLSSVTADMIVTGKYVQNTGGPYTVILQYKDPSDGTIKVLTSIDNVEAGSDVTSKVYVMSPPAIEGYAFDGWANAIITPTDASLASVTQDVTITGTYTSVSSGSGDSGSGDSGSGGSGESGSGGSSGSGEDADILNGNAFYAYYYYPNGVDLYTKIKINKGDYAFNLIRPEGYSSGYEWSPNPLETVMESNHNFVLVPSEGTDTTETYTVSYYYTDGVTLYQQIDIETGSFAPNLMMPAGYTKCVWSPSPTDTEITKNTRFTMVAGSGTSTDDGNTNDGTSTDGTTTDTGNYYTLTVVNGSGSGTYKAGTQAIIVANEPASGLQFGSWTISPDNAVIASKGLSATVVTMPSENVTVTANYITKTSGGNNNGSGNNSSSGNNNGGTTPSSGTKTSSGTTVVIDKNGLSNTGVVSAVVNGSSDNFTIKISETSAASEAVLKALQAQFGDISKIVYFPMDISLYNAAGDKKITDTTGLTITITLPLPDSMIQYGGNNKVASVVNNQLDVLSPKFTTISGVDCVTFTCTHFSPYVIYVNTETISTMGDNSTGRSDVTPKTGDGIKPKWFLATGLAAIGVFFFVWHDRRKKTVAR